MERIIGACGVTGDDSESPQSNRTCEQLLKLIPEHGGVTVAAHVCSASGLLSTLRGQTRTRTWTCTDLLAAALPGAREDAPDAFRQIVLNKDPAHKRRRSIAVINANDVSSPEALADPSTTTWIKMTDPSIEGLRQAFLDWESRIRLNSDPIPADHIELVAASWQGGLFDAQSLRLSESLNVLVGGRGSGKSTLIESLRYAFDLPPKAEEARRVHENMIKNVLGPGASVAVLIRSPKPSPQYYLVERVYGNRPSVRNQSGELLDAVRPAAVLGSLEIYGQHEISELTRYPDKLAELLRRFTAADSSAVTEKTQIKDQMKRSKDAILGEIGNIGRIDEALSALPTLKEHLKRFAAAGLDEKLKNKTSIDREERIFEAAETLVSVAESAAESLHADAVASPLIGDQASSLPNGELLKELDAVQIALSEAKTAAALSIKAAAKMASEAIARIKGEWGPKKQESMAQYQKLLRDLKAEGHDAAQYVSFKTQLERLKPKETDLATRKQALATLRKERSELLSKWEAAKAADFRSLQSAAKKVSRRLSDRVRVTVRPSATLDELSGVLRTHCSGNYNQGLDRLRAQEALSLPELAVCIREGAASLTQKYGMSAAAAGRIAQGGEILALEIEQCELPAEAVLELNVGNIGVQTWKDLEQLSTGQKATAVLLLLLLESDAPLIVDQPEDDLDNRFIADCIVQTMREEKRRRQFVFSSHNANIPVLGDAEQIVGLKSEVDGTSERALIADETCGSIDTPAVKELVKDLLEGGQEAFEFRKQRYGF